MKLIIIITLALCGLSRTANAHRPSEAHVRLSVDGDRIALRVDIAIRDLDGAVGIDGDGDGAVTWREVLDASPRITEYVTARLDLTAGAQPCVLAPMPVGLVELSDGTYLAVPFTCTCSAEELRLAYGLLFELDNQHRALVHVSSEGRNQILIATNDTPIHIGLADDTRLRTFVFDGVTHIWAGLDHLLFLTCLLLPAVYSKQRTKTLRTVSVEVFEIVTAFTLAHSITLVCSALGFVTLPTRFVETAIALSVAFAAVNNLVRVVDARWLVAFCLGLLHGFGFSSVLLDLGLPSQDLVGALLGFNLGVELGQVAFVIVLLPILYAIRNTVLYRVALWGGSTAIAIIALIWSVQRWLE